MTMRDSHLAVSLGSRPAGMDVASWYGSAYLSLNLLGELRLQCWRHCKLGIRTPSSSGWSIVHTLILHIRNNPISLFRPANHKTTLLALSLKSMYRE